MFSTLTLSQIAIIECRMGAGKICLIVAQPCIVSYGGATVAGDLVGGYQWIERHCKVITTLEMMFFEVYLGDIWGSHDKTTTIPS